MLGHDLLQCCATKFVAVLTNYKLSNWKLMSSDKSILSLNTATDLSRYIAKDYGLTVLHTYIFLISMPVCYELWCCSKKLTAVEGRDNQSHHSKTPLILTMGLFHNRSGNDWRLDYSGNSAYRVTRRVVSGRSKQYLLWPETTLQGPL